jgi:ubiquinone/menaquinone biosynthesis C-methylase UbiE/uncharacterized protein YbaR (Trm112 family)
MDIKEVLLVCPMCKKTMTHSSHGFTCSTCDATYPEFDGIPVMLLPGAEAFKQAEFDYWNQRFVQEGNVAQLSKMYRDVDFTNDVWGITSYMKRVTALVPEGAVVLEVGAGLGSQVIPLTIRDNYSAVITDFAVSSLLVNRDAVDNCGVNGEVTSRIKYYAADADHLPFESDSIDAVVLHATLHHLPNPQKTIREIARCIRPGGLLVLGHEPNRRVFEPIRKLAGWLKITEKHTQRFVAGRYSIADEETPGFYRHELECWLTENGFVIEWATPVFFVNGFLYNFPVLMKILFGARIVVPRRLRHWGNVMDENLFAKIPGIRELFLFWSFGASKR